MSNWSSTISGAIGGAAIAICAVYGLSAYGLMPSSQNNAQIHAYLMDHPEILIAMSDKLRAQQQQNEDDARATAVAKLGTKPFFDPRVAFVTGPANAKTTVVEFFDYNCPYCRASGPAVEAFYNAHKNDTRFAFIEFPIKGDESVAASRLAIAARKQPDKYLAYHFAMMNADGPMTVKMAVEIAQKVGLNLPQLQKDEQDPQVASAIAGANALAHAAGVDGTPAFIVDGKMHEGALTDARLAALVKR